VKTVIPANFLDKKEASGIVRNTDKLLTTENIKPRNSKESSELREIEPRINTKTHEIRKRQRKNLPNARRINTNKHENKHRFPMKQNKIFIRVNSCAFVAKCFERKESYDKS
jgi:hypothetical protein